MNWGGGDGRGGGGGGGARGTVAPVKKIMVWMGLVPLKLSIAVIESLAQ